MAGRAGKLTYQKPEQGSLARAIRSDNSHAITLADKSIYPGKQLPVRKAVGNILQFSHPLGTFAWIIKSKIIKGSSFSWPYNTL